jgi:hypothetical protein
MGQQMPDWVVKGRVSDASWAWGNISFTQSKDELHPYVVIDEKLVRSNHVTFKVEGFHGERE